MASAVQIASNLPYESAFAYIFRSNGTIQRVVWLGGNHYYAFTGVGDEGVSFYEEPTPQLLARRADRSQGDTGGSEITGSRPWYTAELRLGSTDLHVWYEMYPFRKRGIPPNERGVVEPVPGYYTDPATHEPHSFDVGVVYKFHVDHRGHVSHVGDWNIHEVLPVLPDTRIAMRMAYWQHAHAVGGESHAREQGRSCSVCGRDIQ